MSSRRFGSRSRKKSAEFLQKPRGLVQPRVQMVGPEHFGIVSVDCAKARSKWMLADFYGRVPVPPTHVQYPRAELGQAIEQPQLKDLIVAIERTGRYHHVVQRVFAQAGVDTRIVHPFATK